MRVREFASALRPYCRREKPTSRDRPHTGMPAAIVFKGGHIMKLGRYLYVGGVLAALVVGLGVWNPLATAQGDDGKGDNGTPKFRVDPFWPKPMPVTVTNGVAHTWVLGEVAGSCIDAHDNVYTFNRGWQVGVTGPNGLQGNMSGAIVAQDASA